MDITKLPPSPPNEFPNGPTVLGKVYGFQTPWGADIVTMGMDTWIEHGTRLESMRQMLKKQDSRIRELLADVSVRDKLNADTLEKLNNLREVRRQEKRPEVMAQIASMPDLPAQAFTPTKEA